MKDDVFGLHCSAKLNEAYRKKYWQGQNPIHSKVIFLGLDANWDRSIETNNTGIFEEILEYLEDGVSYWKRKGFHHPFLSPTYNRQDGFIYHSRFRKSGITSEYADEISFIELLNIPTYGMSSKSPALYNKMINVDYLKEINSIIFNATPKIVFMPKSVYEKIRSIKNKMKLDFLFDFEMEVEPGANRSNPLMCIHNSTGIFVFVHTHFSNAISDKHLNNIGLIAKSFLDNSAQKLWWQADYTITEENDTKKETKYFLAKDVFGVKEILDRHITSEYMLKKFTELELQIVNEDNVVKSLLLE